MMVRVEGGAPRPAVESGDRLLDIVPIMREAVNKGVIAAGEGLNLDTLFRAEDPREAVKYITGRLDSAPFIEGTAWTHDVPLNGGDLICVGRNYAAHAHELDNPVPLEPILFMKPRSGLLPSGGQIVIPEDAERVEYEGEIALVIGRDLAGDVNQETAARAIFGVTLINDVTDRGLQSKLKSEGKPWLAAKGRPTFAPCGPSIAVLETPAALMEFDVTTVVNGQLRQQGNPSQWNWSPGELVAYIARTTGLKSGDMIATGTPSGAGPMVPGDRIEISSPPVGTLRNSVVAETHQQTESAGSR